MKAQCNYIPDSIWIREEENGLRHITLRNNFGEIPSDEDKTYEYDEVDIYIACNENISDYVATNFDILFEIGMSNNEVKSAVDVLKSQIAETDYKIIKCYEYQLVGNQLPYDLTTLHSERQAIRDRINQLESQ